MSDRRTEPSREGAGAAGRDDWDRHWSAYAESAARNPAQEFRRRIILRLLGADEKPRRVLDIGSGTGDLAGALLHTFPGVEVLGLELSSEGIEIARRKVPAAAFLQSDLSVSASPPPEHVAWATHAVCSEVLEHLDDPIAFLLNGRSFLAPGCIVVVTVPGGPMTAYDRQIGHRRHFRADELADVLVAAGFDVLTAGGVGFPVFNLYRSALRLLGDRVTTVASSERPSAGVRAAMTVVSVLLRANTRISARGWQIVAAARLREEPAVDPPGAP